MFKLYGFIEDERYGRKIEKLEQSENEYKIIKKIDDTIRDQEKIHYLIIKRENETDEYYKSINCYEDFIDYIEYYKQEHTTGRDNNGKNKFR